MSKLLIKNIKSLVQVREENVTKVAGRDMSILPCIEDAWLAIDNGIIADYGKMEDFPGITDWKDLEVIDASGKLVMPCYADSHTHIVYAGNRESEFVDRINGLTYEEIAKRGGGILNSAKKLRETSEDDLFDQSFTRLNEIILQGTGAVEIKSGYGLDLASELKMLRVIKRFKELNLIPVKATFLGAHAVPAEFKDNKKGYIDLIINEMIPAIAKEKLADYIDVFCEKNYFSAEETKQILQTGLKHGLTPKVHAEQLSHSNGIKTAIECNAISVDHLEFCNDDIFEGGKEISTKTNNSGGVQGGISNGQDIYFNVAFKPVATVMQKQKSVNAKGEEVDLEAKGRHDPCVLPRAVPIVENMAALVLVDHLLRSRTSKL